MNIAVDCSQCGAQLRVAAQLAGRRGKCPKCAAMIHIPHVANSPSDVSVGAASLSPVSARGANSESPTQKPTAPPILSKRQSAPPTVDRDVTASPAMLSLSGIPAHKEAILAAVSGAIQPVKTSPAYKATIVLVAAVMVLLPLLYVGLIGGVCYLLYLHAVHNSGLVSGGATRGRAGGWLVMLYLVPLLAGAILVVFMIKPLFARTVRRDKPRSLKREGEPLLFAFVDRLCAAVGAPRPKRIDVDCQVNAAASFRRGWLSILQGNDLVLTIGLPLVAGLNLQQFSGVLAHEFGHFTQGWGMRLSYIVRSISFWFTRVVYERDEWDQQLVEWSQRLDYRLAVIPYLARLFVWLTRKVLWGLMMVGHAVSGLLLRQMEFDADMHETRFAGSDAFASTCRRLAQLGVASRGALSDLDNWYQERRLGDNFPKLIMANLSRLPNEVVTLLNKAIDSSSTGWLDTHPADSQRIGQASRENASGVFHDVRPATELFSDFDALSRTVTYDYYKALLGRELRITDLHPTEKLLGRQESETTNIKSLLRYFQGTFHSVRPLPFSGSWVGPPNDAKQAVARIKALRTEMFTVLGEYRQDFRQFDEAEGQIIQTTEAAAMIDAGIKATNSQAARPPRSEVDVKRARATIRSRLEPLLPKLEKFERLGAERLFIALQLLHVPQVGTKLNIPASSREYYYELYSTAVAIGRKIPNLIELRDVTAALNRLFSHYETQHQKELYVSTVIKCAEKQRRWICDLMESLRTMRYPFEHNRGEQTVSGYCVECTPMSEDLGANMSAAMAMLERLPSLLTRLMAHLAELAERIEALVGLPPLEEPKIDEAVQEEPFTSPPFPPA